MTGLHKLVRLLLTIAGFLIGFRATAQTAPGPVFEKDVYPIFTQYCSTCHGQSSPKLGLDLRTAASTLRGTYDGPVIVKGSPDTSILFQKLATHQMPPPIYGQTVPDTA